MRPIERRLSKIEDASGPPGEVKHMSCAQLHAFLCRSLTEDCRAGKTIEEIAASYRESGEHGIAEMFLEIYEWDPETRIVRMKENIDRDWLAR